MTEVGKIPQNWLVELEHDGEDLILPLPPELLEEVGWQPGDEIEWHDRGDGTWELRRKLQQSANEDS